MTILLLIRHAENDARNVRLAGRQPGIHLNRKGREQAQSLARLCASFPIRAVYSSPMERAFETALPLAQCLKLEVQTLPAITETDYGELQWRTFKQLKRMKIWKAMQAQPSQVRFPGGETFQEAQQRVVAALEDLSADGGMIAVVTHADMIRLALAYYLHMPLDDFQRLHIQPASISVIAVKDGKVGVLHVNQVRDLEFPTVKPEQEQQPAEKPSRAVS